MNITKKIHSVGVINPNLRIFDIIMSADYGTSYNAYVVKGEKVALIETVHEDYFDEYIENIRAVTDLSAVEYLVFNHTEPDHSGSLLKLLELAPQIKVVGTVAAHKYLGAIINCDYEKIVVKQGDSLDLGGVTLDFIPSPFLHWPDSMFTFCKEEKTLFSCDMFGCHYCEPRVFNDKIRHKDDYIKSFRCYYLGIFSPFKKFVLAGIDKIKDLEFDYICPSHGPVIREDIDKIISMYKTWSSEAVKEVKTATVVYASAYGYTKKLAETIADTLEKEDIEVEIFDVNCENIGGAAFAIEKNDMLFIGSPTINKDAVKPIWDIMTSVDAYKNSGKICGVFGSYGWSGEAVPMLVARANSLGLKVAGDGLKVMFNPSDDEIKATKEYVLSAIGK